MIDQIDAKLSAAMKKVITESQFLFDQCLLDKFYAMINAEPSKFIVVELEKYFNHDSFAMFNQNAAIKIAEALISSSRFKEYNILFEDIIPLLNSFWNVLPDILVSKNLSSIAAFLSLLAAVIKFEDGYSWIMSKRFDPPTKIDYRSRTSTISGLPTIIEHFLSFNYSNHIVVNAEKLLKDLLIANFNYKDKPSRLHEIVLNLFSIGNNYIIQVLLDICSNDCLGKLAFEEHIGLKGIVRQSFDSLICKSDYDMSLFAKYLALAVDKKEDSDYYITNLIKNNHIEATIVFLSNQKDFDEQKWVSFVVGPILARCQGNEILLKKLSISSGQFDSICGRNDIIQSAMTNLNQISNSKPSLLSRTTKNNVAHSLLLFIKQHYESNCDFKLVKECSTILLRLASLLEDIDEFVEQLESILIDSIKGVHLQQHVSIITSELLKVVAMIYRKLHHNSDIGTQVIDLLITLLNIANNTPNQDQLVEDILDVVSIDMSKFINARNDSGSLIWNMFEKHKNSTHSAMIAQLIQLLIAIDTECQDLFFVENHISRYENIPNEISTILRNNPTEYNMIKHIIETISRSNYLSSLKNQQSVNELSKSFCQLIRLQFERTSCVISIIDSAVDVIFQQNGSKEVVLKRLVANNILPSLATISFCEFETNECRSSALKIIEKIREYMFGNQGESISSILNQHIEDQQTAKEIAALLSPDTSQIESVKKIKLVDNSCESLQPIIQLSSVLDEILLYGEGLCKALDCY